MFKISRKKFKLTLVVFSLLMALFAGDLGGSAQQQSVKADSPPPDQQLVLYTVYDLYSGTSIENGLLAAGAGGDALPAQAQDQWESLLHKYWDFDNGSGYKGIRAGDFPTNFDSNDIPAGAIDPQPQQVKIYVSKVTSVTNIYQGQTPDWQQIIKTVLEQILLEQCEDCMTIQDITAIRAKVTINSFTDNGDGSFSLNVTRNLLNGDEVISSSTDDLTLGPVGTFDNNEVGQYKLQWWSSSQVISIINVLPPAAQPSPEPPSPEPDHPNSQTNESNSSKTPVTVAPPSTGFRI